MDSLSKNGIRKVLCQWRNISVSQYGKETRCKLRSSKNCPVSSNWQHFRCFSDRKISKKCYRVRDLKHWSFFGCAKLRLGSVKRIARITILHCFGRCVSPCLSDEINLFSRSSNVKAYLDFNVSEPCSPSNSMLSRAHVGISRCALKSEDWRFVTVRGEKNIGPQKLSNLVFFEYSILTYNVCIAFQHVQIVLHLFSRHLRAFCFSSLWYSHFKLASSQLRYTAPLQSHENATGTTRYLFLIAQTRNTLLLFKVTGVQPATNVTPSNFRACN